MGVVIGETAEVGDGCTIYQGVTLGGTGKDKGKRHPTLGKNVTVGCGAKILGPFKVGDGAKVAANAVLLESIPPASTAVGVPARIARVGGRKPNTLDHVHLPDPVAQEICKLQFELDRLEKRIRELGMNPEDYWWYCDLRRYGSCRHAGFGLGFERMVMYLTGIGNIRDVELHPRTVGNADF